MAIATTIRVTDDSTREEVAEAMGYVNYRAKRSQHIIEKLTTDPPTEWSRRHALLNAMLTDWESRA